MSNQTISRYPLQWPAGWPRTAPTKREKGSFKSTVAAALTNVEDELRRLGGRAVVVSSNVTLGLATPEDPGVAVYFVYDNEPTAIPCDRWSTVAANLQAIAKTVEAMRGIERWGAKHMVKAAFRGFLQLAGPNPRHWSVVLGIMADTRPDVARTAYQRVRSAAHPDKPDGNADRFAEVERAWRAFCDERGVTP